MVTSRRQLNTEHHLDVILAALQERFHPELAVTAFLFDPTPTDTFRRMLAAVPYADQQLFLALIRAEVLKHNRPLTPEQDEFLAQHTACRLGKPRLAKYDVTTGYVDDVDYSQRDE